MDESSKAKEKSRLQRQISQFFHKGSEWSRTILTVFERREWDAVLFGGVPRGVHRSQNYSPRDLDIVICDRHFADFADFFSQFVTRETRFGGIHLEWNTIEIDAWPLGSTWAFRKQLVPCASFENLVKTTFFTADALAVDLIPRRNRGRRIYEGGFFDAWKERLLEINLAENPFPELCVVRGLHLSETYHFRFSPALSRYVFRSLETISLSGFEQVQASHYGKPLYDRNVLISLRTKLAEHLEQHPLLPFSPFELGLDDHALRKRRTDKSVLFHPF